MNKIEDGQVFIVVAVLLAVTLIILPLIIDGARLMVKQQELNRAADAAAKAGLIIVGDRMVTQVAGAQTAAASSTFSGAPVGGTPSPTLTPVPEIDDFFSWMNDDHRSTLVAPPMQTQVANQVRDSAEKNDIGLSDPFISGLEIMYPYQYHGGDQDIQLVVCIKRNVPILFGGLFNLEEGVLIGNSKQTIPQR